MFFNWEPSLLIAAGASFLAGLLGYGIARLWIKPIVGYNIAKRRLDRALSQCLERLPPAEEPRRSPSSGDFRTILKAVRGHALNLAARYGTELPAWYRLFLVSRGESPEDAMKLLAPLSKISASDQIRERVDRARKMMRLS